MITEVANGSTIKIRKYTNLKFNIFNDTSNTYTTRFNILPYPKGQPILGMRFLLENNSVINLREKTINIDGTKYDVEIHDETNTFEDEVISKTRVYEIKDYKKKISELIKNQKTRNPRIGNIKNAEHKIEVFDTLKLIKREYQVPIGLTEDVEEHLETLLKDGIITEKYSSFISPAFAIRKKNGKIRLIVDYRALNSITVKCHQFTPNMFELLSRLKGATIFSNVDLNQGYYQVIIAKKDVDKTGFKILNRTFVFNKMPFGLCNAPSTFQRIMKGMLKKVKNIIIYLDDILIFSDNYRTHYETLSEVFEIFNSNNVLINFEKSKFLQSEIRFLGNHITADGIQPDISKINEYEFKAPKTKTQLQKILGLLNWYRPFVPLISVKLSEVYALLKSKNKKMGWENKHTDIFKDIVEEIKKRIILHHPDLHKPFTLKTNASDKGIGSILLQDDKVIGFFSKKYNQQEQNYSVVEKEVFAIIKSIVHFKPIIYNAPITIMTDNKNIIYNGDLSRRINSWKLILEEFDYKIVHIESAKKHEADILSRSFRICNYKLMQPPELPKLSIEKLQECKKWDSKKMYKANSMNELKKTLNSLHETLMNPGIVRFQRIIKKYIEFPINKKYIDQIIKECIVCNKKKDSPHKYGVVEYEFNV
ncbi:Retrovirus-related Pol polyprotein from transposon 17.6 [Dictyocoela roeselum]|nr:Retrovirus-related Pol polyprotein from transposon 17.6 [Dictyocoela roeselum]